MRKRNKLYIANKWNQPLFLANTFAEGGATEDSTMLAFDKAASEAYGANYGDKGFTLNDYMNSKNALGISKTDNPFSKGNLTNTFSGKNMLNTLKGGAGAIGGAIGKIGGNLISGGLSSGAGKAISNIGGTIGSVVGAVNPVFGAAISAATGIIGGGVNALIGTKTDQKKLNAANEGTNYLNSFSSNAKSFDDIKSFKAQTNVQNAFKGGALKKGWARKKNAELKAQRADAESWANRSIENNISNISDTQMDNALANYSAFGGPLDSQGAIGYSFMSDYLTTKNKANSIKDKVESNIFGSLASTPFFALGGDLQSNGTDWSTGLNIVDAGGSHEENPYGGIQVGRDSNGTPNLVEEGETIFDDFVYSNRIKVDNQTKDRFHLGKKADMTYAELSKKLQKENEERPNDAISQKGLTKQLHDLAEEQERQKSEEQEQKMQEIFNSLPPEQQAEIIQQIAMQEQQAQQDAQQQGMQGQQVMQENMQQPNGQQIIEQQQMEQPMVDNGEMNACGGRINKYDKGGDMKKKMYNLLGLHTDSDFDKWVYDQKLDKITDWENITKNKPFMSALASVNPIVADAISRGYDFGTYVPNKNNNLTFDFTHGGWGAEDYNAWNGSKDAAWKEAVKKGLVKEGMNSEEIGKALSQTDAYKRGSDWLRNSENNRLNYLQQILNSNDAPQAARDYAAKYVDANGWLKDVKRDYQTIFEDPNGTGVRNTHPGTYWKTPNEILRDSQTNNYVVNDDGSVEEIIGNVPKDWASAGNYSWADDKSDYTANYYRRPVVIGNDNEDNGDDNNEGTITPVHKPTWGRTAGLLGPAVGLGMQALGIGKPDYSRINAALNIANEAPVLANAKTIGNYLAYNPMDIWYEQNRLNANSRATDRSIMNNASPIGTKMAGLLANGYNNQIASGELYRKALEYNDADRVKKADFNRGTDIYNANALNQVSATNAQMLNNNRQARASMAMNAAAQRMAADAAWNQGIYGNVNGLFAGLGAWGKENEQNNMIADMAADGIFGTISDKQNIGKGKVTVRKSAKGGCIRRKKKGLTF